jgi:hypothetical protein
MLPGGCYHLPFDPLDDNPKDQNGQSSGDEDGMCLVGTIHELSLQSGTYNYWRKP